LSGLTVNSYPVHMTTAFEPPAEFGILATPWGNWTLEGDGDGFANSKVGYAYLETSVVYIETALDYNRIPDVDHYYAIIGAHEMGHQLGLSRGKSTKPPEFHREKPMNIMSTGALNAALQGGQPFNTVQVHPIDIAWLRAKIHSPNGDRDWW
jgi:hypothetical protein